MLLLGEYDHASMYYDEASKLDEGNLAALHGRIKCKILQGNHKDAEQELEFLSEISSMGSSPELIFLQALLALKRGQQSASVDLLNQSFDEHMKLIKKVPAGYFCCVRFGSSFFSRMFVSGFEYFCAYNPDFVLELVQAYMSHIGITITHRTK